MDKLVFRDYKVLFVCLVVVVVFQAHLCGAFIHKHASFTLFHAPLHIAVLQSVSCLTAKAQQDPVLDIS